MKRIKLSTLIASLAMLLFAAFLFGQQTAPTSQPDQPAAQQPAQQPDSTSQQPDQPMSAQPSQQSDSSQQPESSTDQSDKSMDKSEKMPKTASDLPLLALLGCLSLAAAGVVHVTSKRRG